MENRFTSEMIEKAKAAQSAEEIKSLAKESGYEMTDEEANAYFEQFHKTGELSDEELGSVAGGGCHTKDGRLVTSVAMQPCADHGDLWRCECGCNQRKYNRGVCEWQCSNCLSSLDCGTCRFCVYEKGLWLCDRDEMRI